MAFKSMHTAPSSYYQNISEAEAREIADACEWILKSDWKHRNNADDGESAIIRATYSGKQYFGSTDYKDHRADTLADLRALVYEHITSGRHQRIHYFEDDNKPFTKIVVEGYLGGYTAYFA